MSRASCPLDMTEVTSLSGGRLLTFADEIIDWERNTARPATGDDETRDDARSATATGALLRE